MSEPQDDAFERKARPRRRALDQEVSGERRGAAGAPTVGKRSLTEGVSAGYTAADAPAFFERSIGEARAQLAALAGAVASGDRVAAVTAAGSLRRSLRTARDHLGHLPTPGHERHERLAELEARADRALADARATGLVPPEAARAGTVLPRVQPASSPNTPPARPGAITGPATPIYVNQNAAPILAAIADRVTRVGLPEPHARLRWKAPREAAAALAREIRGHVALAPGLTLKRLMLLSQPADLFAIVDDLRRRPGPIAWRPEIAAAIAVAFDEPITASVRRMGMRVRARMDVQTDLPSVQSLVASCPLDRVVGELLVDPALVVRGARPPRGAADDTPGHTFEHGPRHVTYEWQGERDPALWNWIRVTSPADATVEEVAQIPFLGGDVIDSEQAYRIAASPPYFGIPFETAKRVPKARVHAPYDLERRFQLGDPGPRYADRSALARSKLADDAALAQAPKPARHDPTLDRALGRVRLQLAYMQQKLAPWKAARPLTPATRFLERRRAELAGDRRKAERWTAAVAAQERALHGTSSELVEVLAELDAQGAAPSAAATLGPVVRMLEAYAHAGGVSHLGAEAPAALEAARRLRALLPLAIAEDRIRLAREALAVQQGAQLAAGGVDPHSHRTLADVPDLAARGADLRLAATRTGALDPEQTDELAADADLTSLRAQIITLRMQLQAVEKHATAVGIPDARYRHGLPTLRALPAVLRRESDGWFAHLDDKNLTLGPGEGSERKRRTARKRRAMADVERRLTAFKEVAGIGQPDGYFAWAREVIEDQMWRDLIAGVAVQVAILLATAQVASAGFAVLRGIAVGAEVVAGIRAMGTIFKVAEVVTQAGLATGVQGMMGGKVGRREFTENALAFVLGSAAMRPFRGLLQETAAIEQEVHGLAKAALRGGRLAAELALETGAGLAAAAAARMAAHGGRFSIAGTDEWVSQAISFAAGRFVHQRVQRVRERLRALKAQRREASEALDAAMKQAEVLEQRAAAAKRPTADEATSLLAQYRRILELESALYPPILRGGHQAANAADRGALGSADAADLPLHLAKLSPVVAGEIYEGSPAQIQRAFEIAKRLGIALEPTHDAASGMWRVRAGSRTLSIRELAEAHDGAARPQTAPGPREPATAKTPPRASMAARKRALEELATIPVSTAAAAGAASAPRDSYYVTPESGARMLELLGVLAPEVQVRSYKKGFLVRRGQDEWYFEYGDKAPDHRETLPRGRVGLPAPNAATVELWGFRGVRTIHGRTRDKWTPAEATEVRDKIKEDQLLWAGHVGISIDGGKTIFGFTPNQPADMKPEPFMRSLRDHDAYPGVVNNDTDVFIKAKQNAETLGWNTELITVIELVDKPRKLETAAQLSKMTGMKPGEHGLGYALPLEQPEGGQHFRDSNGYRGGDIRNCATFPEKVGVKIPDQSGILGTYIPALERWAHGDGPIDLRTTSEKASKP